MKNIVEVAVEAGSFKTLVAAVKAAGLAETLQGPGPFTVFAPTDAAFAKLPAGTVEALLADKEALAEFLQLMYGDEPLRWDAKLQGALRLRFVINVLTRTRFVAADGTLELKTKEGADAAPRGYYPWFDVPFRRTAGTPIAFGHWSALGLLDRPDLLGLDTGCVWGQRLSAARIDDAGGREVIQVDCEKRREPRA
jgi:bis(5'-nucleosyl)-tetraphosphatase (symmetrical)